MAWRTGTLAMAAAAIVIGLGGSIAPAPASAPAGPCAGSYILCDDFAGSAIDTNRWTVANVDIANRYPVRRANIVLTTVDDNGTTITVVDAKSFGDAHSAAPRQGGVLVTKLRYGGGRYEARMKNLPGANGCSCFWNYYDSRTEADPPPTRVYTEIDMEMPAHLASPPAWAAWRKTLGFNSWSRTDADADATYIQHVSAIDPFDGQFHIFRFDWHDGTDGSRKIDWYVDGVLQASTAAHVSDAPAQLWVGNWPAFWPGMDYNFNVRHQYIDWVRISALP